MEMLLPMRGREEDEKEMEDEEEEKEEEVKEEDEEEELSFLLSRKLSRVSMSKSILLSDGFTVAVLRESMTAWTLIPWLFTTVSASFLINESFLMFFSSSS